MEFLLGRSLRLSIFPFEDAWFWLINLENIDLGEVEKAKSLLDSEDLRRSSRYIFEKDRYKSILIYAITKFYLGRILNESPQKVTLLRNKFGKPYLDKNRLHFNLSHTNNYAFLGIHPSRAIGVDIEKIDNDIPILDGAGSFLFPCEKQWLFSSFKDPREGALTLWCAKEALLKAAGIGFSANSLPQFTVALNICNKISCLKGIAQFLVNKVDVHVYHDTLADHKLAVSIL